MVQVSTFNVQGNLHMRASKSGTPFKVAIFPMYVGQSFVKTVADQHGHAIGFRASREH